MKSDNEERDGEKNNTCPKMTKRGEGREREKHEKYR